VAADAILSRGGVLVTATPRLARYLRFLHDESRLAAGDRAWPTADVLPLDAWLRRHWETAVLGEGPAARRRLLTDDEVRLAWRRVITTDREGPEAGVLVPLVAQGWRLCQDWHITLEQLAAAAESDDARLFVRWVRAYVALKDRQGWQDSGDLLAHLGADRPVEPLLPAVNTPLGLAGFDAWTPALARLVARLRAAGQPVHEVAPVRRAGRLGCRAARDPEDELAAAFAWAARVMQAGRPGPAIVVANLEQEAPRIRRLGLDILAPGWQIRPPAVSPVALAVGRRLADYPLVHVALLLLDLLADGVAFEAASLLLRSVYLAGAEEERSGRAAAEIALRQVPLDRVRTGNLSSALEGRAPVLGNRLRQAADLAGESRGRRLAPGAWAAELSRWLAMAGWPGTRPLDSEEFQALDAWQRLLESFAATEEVTGLLSAKALGGVLRQFARDRPFEPEGAPDAVQVLTPREALGQSFPALWIAGLTADQWPPAPRPNPLVPLGLQRAAGIPDATPAGLLASATRRFTSLLAAADDVVVSWPAEVEGAATLPSPLLAERAAPTDPGPRAIPHPDRLVLAAAGPVELMAGELPPPFVASGTLRGGARLLAMQAVCPARAFIEFRLGARPVEPPVRPLDAAARGSLVHALLEQLYREPGCTRGLGGTDPHELRRCFDALIGPVLARALPSGDAYFDALRGLEAERVWRLVLALRAIEQDRPGFRVVTEEPREVALGPLTLHIRLDRIDVLDAGGQLVVDYKTGRFAARGWRHPRVPESQLPLYAISGGCTGVAVIELRAGGARLRGVGAEGSVPGVKSPGEFFREPGLDWPQALDRWRTRLEGLAAEFAQGDFRVDPADRRWATDPFAALTRIHDLAPAGEEGEEGDEGDAR